jgi:hypothetical protein
MRAGQVVACAEQPTDDGPKSERIEHPAGDVIQMHLLKPSQAFRLLERSRAPLLSSLFAIHLEASCQRRFGERSSPY